MNPHTTEGGFVDTAPAGDVLRSLHKRQPMHWWQRRPPATAVELATAALEDARCMLLDHKAKAGYHASMARMLRDRERFLQAELKRLSTP